MSNAQRQPALRLVIASLVMVLFCAHCGWAQRLSFHSRKDYLGENESEQLAAGDFNHDGNPDIVTVDHLGTVSISLGAAHGTFAAPLSYPISGVNTQSVTVADFNLDGNLDVIVNADTSGTTGVYLYLGNGDGTLQDGRLIPVPSRLGNASWVASADVNNDGKADIAVLRAADVSPGASVVVLLGAGDGTFPATAAHSFPNGANAMAVGDVNGDGNADLAVAADDSIFVFLGNGDGTLQAPLTLAAGAGAAIAVGDVNGDGFGDLVVAGRTTSNLSSVLVLISQGNGQFRAPAAYTTETSPISIVLADFNHDGRLDIALSDKSVSILLNTGNGRFEHSTAFPAGRSASEIASSDLNGDGLPDVAVADAGPGVQTMTVLLREQQGGFGAAATIALPGTSAGVLIGDFNGDGKADIAASVIDQSNGVAVSLGGGDGRFQPVFFTPLPAEQTDIVAGDFNGDGKLDLAGAGLHDSHIYVLPGNGDGTFQSPQTMQVSSSTTALTAGDFNGDGKLDLALINGDLHFPTVLIALGNGDGMFQPPVTYFAGSSPVQMIAGDFNNDGKLDLAVANSADADAGVLLGNGDGTFQPVLLFGTAGNPVSLAGADVNADGKLDIVAGCGTSGVCVLVNNTAH